MATKNRLQIAGAQLAKGNVTGAVKSLFTSGQSISVIGNNDYRGDNGAGFWVFGSDGTERHFIYGNRNDAYNAYVNCSPLFSIIVKKAQAFVAGTHAIQNKNGKEAASEQAKKIRALLAKPNHVQSGAEFKAQGYIHRQLFGYNIIYINKPVGFGVEDASSIWNIPPNMLELEESENVFFYGQKNEGIAKATLVYKRTRIPLDVNNIFIVKDFAPSFDSVYLPQSRVQPLAQEINNIIGAYKSRNVLINKRGALGMITPEKQDPSGTVSLTEKEKLALEKEYSKKHGLLDHQAQIIISSAAVKWQSMGYATKELMLFEEVEDDIMRICDAFGYPYPLIASNRTNSLGGNNITASITYLYQETIIPEAISWAEQMNTLFGLEGDVQIKVSYDHIAALQEDKAKQASAELIKTQAKKIQYEAGVITLNQFIESLGYPNIGTDGEVYYGGISEGNANIATALGTTGVANVLSVLQAAGISPEARASTLQILFGISAADAAAMTAEGETNNDSQTQPPINQA